MNWLDLPNPTDLIAGIAPNATTWANSFSLIIAMILGIFIAFALLNTLKNFILNKLGFLTSKSSTPSSIRIGNTILDLHGTAQRENGNSTYYYGHPYKSNKKFKFL